jgi:hypothetical protein
MPQPSAAASGGGGATVRPGGGGFGGGVGGFRRGIAAPVGGFRGGIAAPVGGFLGGAIRVGQGGGLRGGVAGTRYGYGYRPGAVYRSPRPYGPAYAYRPYYRGFYGRRYPYYGGAVAAGLIGGLAFGALSYPYYDYPYGYDDPAYDVADGEDCAWVRRRVVDSLGRVVVRRVQVCED